MSGSQQQNQDMKPSYAITSKLLRVVAVLTLQYHGKNIFLLKILYIILQKINQKMLPPFRFDCFTQRFTSLIQQRSVINP